MIRSFFVVTPLTNMQFHHDGSKAISFLLPFCILLTFSFSMPVTALINSFPKGDICSPLPFLQPQRWKPSFISRHHSWWMTQAARSPLDLTDNDNMFNMLWNDEPYMSRQVYISPVLWRNNEQWKDFMLSLKSNDTRDHLWEQIKLEAMDALTIEPDAGPQLYQGILSQGSLLEAVVTTIAHEIETELIKATEIKKLFMDLLTNEDEISIHCDVIAAATRSPSVKSALLATLFQTGLHALVCYRVGHRLWIQNRSGLAYYFQSTVSRQYSADIHPACQMGQGIYLSTSAGVVIGETATVGNDVSILQGVTLGGTGKEIGDRHPKVQHGVILEDSATVLGNIPIGTGTIVKAKAIVTKPIPPLSIVSGVPGKIIAHRDLSEDAFQDDLERHLSFKYLVEWRALEGERESTQKN